MYKDDASKLVLVSLKDDNSILYIFHLILATDVDPNYEVLSFKRSYFNFRVTIFWKDAITHTVPSSFIVEAVRVKKPLSSYGLAPSTIFGVVVL